MKLAYLINQYPAISHSFIRREIEALERCGVEVARFSIRPSANGLISEEDRREAEKTRTILGVGFFAIVFGILSSLIFRPARSIAATAKATALGSRSDAGILRHFFYAGEAFVLASWMRKAGVTHVHAHFGTNSAMVAMLAARINDGSFSMTVHGPEEFDPGRRIALPEKIRNAAFVAAVSNYGASQLRRLVDPEYWDRIRVVPCGVEKAFYDGASEGYAEQTTFVSVGRLSEQKGQLTLIEAAAVAKRRGGRFKLILIGDGDMRGDIEAAVARHDLSDEVELAGWKTPAEVRSAILNARAFVLPSYAEGLPVSIMEAMLLGRPVISTYVAGIPELVVPGETGWLVPAADAQALAGAMMAALAASPERIAEMGRAGRARAAARHDIDSVAAHLKSIFAEALEA